MNLSVIIVSYNAVDYLDECLKSIEENLIPEMEVIVWDNNSPDRSITKLEKKYPEFNFIFHTENLGFSKGSNRAAALTKGEYILILNPDTVVSTSFFSSLLDFAVTKPNLGAAGVRLTDEQGKLWPESKRNTPNLCNSFARVFKCNLKESKPYHALHLAEDEVGEVEVLSGACMLLRKEVYEEVGGFDERYFMYGEDIDLSYTLIRHGYTNYYIGQIALIHHKGESTIRDKKFLKRFYGAMELFLEKYEKPKNVFLYMIALLGVKLKYTIERFKLIMR